MISTLSAAEFVRWRRLEDAGQGRAVGGDGLSGDGNQTLKVSENL